MLSMVTFSNLNFPPLQVLTSAGVVTAVLLAAVFLGISVHRMTTAIQMFAEEARVKAKLILMEKKRSDGLLYQMLPRSVRITFKLFLQSRNL